MWGDGKCQVTRRLGGGGGGRRGGGGGRGGGGVMGGGGRTSVSSVYTSTKLRLVAVRECNQRMNARRGN